MKITPITSALAPKAEVAGHVRYVRYVPILLQKSAAAMGGRPFR